VGVKMTKRVVRRMKRYHKDLYFPEWSSKSLKAFADGIRTRGKREQGNGSITFSLHAVEKSAEYLFEYGRRFIKFLSKVIRDDALKNGEVFEFYAIDEEIKKVCYRIASTNSPVDLVLVISADGVVITMFVANKGDNHDTLDESLYERS
jgi:hypothetical protein